MFCRHCGKEIPDSSQFCQFCGGRLGVDEPKQEKVEPLIMSNEQKTKNKVKNRNFLIFLTLVFVVTLSIIYVRSNTPPPPIEYMQLQSGLKRPTLESCKSELQAMSHEVVKVAKEKYRWDDAICDRLSETITYNPTKDTYNFVGEFEILSSKHPEYNHMVCLYAVIFQYDDSKSDNPWILKFFSINDTPLIDLMDEEPPAGE